MFRGVAPVLVTARFSPDGSLLVSGKLDGTLMLWDVATARALGPAIAGNGDIVDLEFSPDGKTFASISYSGNVVLWDVAARRRLGPWFPWFESPTFAKGIRFSPDGKLLAVWGLDNKVTFWDIATRRPLGRPISGENGVALSDDFKTVASLGADGVLLRDLSFLTDTSRQSWQARACGIANRNLTRAEWTNYFGGEPYRASCPGLPLDEDAPQSPPPVFGEARPSE
jgi:WD40 repeat protein